MTYEVAKQLKDAGFPLKTQRIEVEREPVFVGGESVYFPYLDELIEACGEEVFFLNATKTRGQNNSWFAKIEVNNKEIGRGLGKTPEEAVAKLWLALKDAADSEAKS